MEHQLLLYEYVEDVLERRGPHREAHLAHVRAALASGRAIMAGPLGEPVTGGAFVFRGVSRAEVLAFADADPYTAAGLIRSRRIEPWKLL